MMSAMPRSLRLLDSIRWTVVASCELRGASSWRGSLHITQVDGLRPSCVGIDGYCVEFPFADSPLDHALTYCDLTTGPDGSPVSLAWRVQEISDRHGSESTVARAIRSGMSELERACRLTEELVADLDQRMAGSAALR